MCNTDLEVNDKDKILILKNLKNIKYISIYKQLKTIKLITNI